MLSPSTGIIDSHAFMLALHGDAERHGAMIALETPVVGGEVDPRGLIIETGGANPSRIGAKLVVNAAGLGAQGVARSISQMPRDRIPALHLAKGNYFSLAMRSPFSRLIYPMPAEGGLGVHLTLDLAGRARFGPDVEWIEAIDYAVDPKRAESFYAAIRTYWPELPDGSLQPDYSGIRPKIARPGGSNTDFRHPDRKRSRRRRVNQSVWDRVARTDRQPGDCRMDCAADLKIASPGARDRGERKRTSTSSRRPLNSLARPAAPRPDQASERAGRAFARAESYTESASRGEAWRSRGHRRGPTIPWIAASLRSSR